MADIGVNDLQNAVEQMHDCSAVHVATEAISETFQGQPVWDGVVHVFEITGHPEATRCYAWSSPVESSSKRRFYAVLEIPPVQSVQDAVRAAIVAEHRRGNTGGANS